METNYIFNKEKFYKWALENDVDLTEYKEDAEKMHNQKVIKSDWDHLVNDQIRYLCLGNDVLLEWCDEKL